MHAHTHMHIGMLIQISDISDNRQWLSWCILETLVNWQTHSADGVTAQLKSTHHALPCHAYSEC